MANCTKVRIHAFHSITSSHHGIVKIHYTKNTRHLWFGDNILLMLRKKKAGNGNCSDLEMFNPKALGMACKCMPCPL